MQVGPEVESEFATRCDLLGDLGPTAERLTQELLRARGIKTHSVRHRVKSLASLQRKISREDADYESLGDIHDLLGVRVITFFPDEVDLVSDVIEDEFDIDPKNSVDKRATLAPDRFGYLSRHYVSRLHPKRCQLSEFARFEDCWFEIQIRSILQHAWAEIEHDLGYQSETAIPSAMRRRFSRLAGLLEIADDEFQALRNDVSEYQATIDEGVDKAPASVSIDQDSIAALIGASPIIRELDIFIADALGKGFAEGSESNAGRRATQMQLIGLQNIAEVSDLIEKRQQLVRDFAVGWAKRDSWSNSTEVSAGISLFYLAYVCVTDSRSVKAAFDYLEISNIGPESQRESVAKELVATRNEIDPNGA